MKALTLWQPWASLVALGHKRIETRCWETKYRGTLAIHAAAALPPKWLGASRHQPAFRVKIGGEECDEPCPNDGEPMRRVTWKEQAIESGESAREVMLALIESVGLQSHYAMLLNEYDGGERLQFSCVAEWIERLKKVGKALMSYREENGQVSAATLRAELNESWLPIAKALLELSRAMDYEKVEPIEGSVLAAVIYEAASELRALKSQLANVPTDGGPGPGIAKPNEKDT